MKYIKYIIGYTQSIIACERTNQIVHIHKHYVLDRKIRSTKTKQLNAMLSSSYTYGVVVSMFDISP